MKATAVAVGLACAIALSVAHGANGHADQVQSPVSGNMAPAINTCFSIIDLFNGVDCSYAATRYPGKTGQTSGALTTADSWIGPVFSSGFYAKGSAADPAQ